MRQMRNTVLYARMSGTLLAVAGVALAFAVAAALLDGAAALEPGTHPLDPLTAEEYTTVVAALTEGGYVDGASLYPLITLEEPPKEEVLRWQPGDPTSRRAFVVVKKGPRTFEAVVDATGGRVFSWREIEGVQPGLLPSVEWSMVQLIVRGDRAWQTAAAERGIEDFRDVVCVPNPVGYYGVALEEGRRLVKVVCYASADTDNHWGRPIEGLIALVDLDARELVRLIDTGAVPLPEGPVDLDGDSVGPLRQPPHAISMVQPRGPSFRVDGRVVNWQKWQFHFRIDPRLGPVVSLVRYDDRGSLRSVLYQGSLSELFIPYMDPDIGWYFRTYLDAGENGVGRLAAVLQPGLDCPGTARFFDATFSGDRGEPYIQENASCLFERYAGDVAWRHTEAATGRSDIRRRTDLVLRSVAAIGNYDYIFDWIFRQDGTIEIAVGASGIAQVKAVASRTIADDDGRDTAYGRLVAEHTVAVNHDHFFSYRLDLDVDDRRNSLMVDRLRPEPVGTDSPRRSIWVVDSQTAATEADARLRIDLERPALWRVVNPDIPGPLGYPASYQLKPKTNAISLLAEDDFPQRRAAFTTAHLWVTPYHPQERYAAGTYPNQSRGGDGLPAWTSADRPIRNTDIVLWYTLGFHHVVRAEDWPVLPTTWHAFELKPFDFFERNPALDLPESAGN